MIAYALNLADLGFTLYALAHGAAELNPLMRNPAVMIGWKTVGVGVLCWVLEWLASTPLKGGSQVARWGLRGCAAVYALICAHHLNNI